MMMVDEISGVGGVPRPIFTNVGRKRPNPSDGKTALRFRPRPGALLKCPVSCKRPNHCPTFVKIESSGLATISRVVGTMTKRSFARRLNG